MRSLSLALVLGAGVAFAADFGQDMVDCKITLANGDVYMRGEYDPVADLVVKLTLTNKTAPEKRAKVEQTVTRAEYLSADDMAKFEKKEFEKNELFQAKLRETLDPKVTRTPKQVWPVNDKSLGFLYVPPELGAHDVVEFIITKQAEEGQAADAKTRPISRDMSVEHTGRSDVIPTAYLAAGETTPEFSLPAGKFYKIKDPGTYSIKAVLRGIGDTGKPEKVVESNEERFRVLPFKIVDRKIESLKDWWAEFERGHPDFNYMVYQLNRTAPFDEIYYVTRLFVCGREQWEWRRLCSVAAGGKVQVKQVTPTQVALLAPHQKGDSALYTVDFSKVDPLVTCENFPPGVNKTLKVEGGKASAE